MKKIYIKPVMIDEENLQAGEMICAPVIGSSGAGTSTLPGNKGDSRGLGFDDDDDDKALDDFFRNW